jgi:hypothetical protein
MRKGYQKRVYLVQELEEVECSDTSVVLATHETGRIIVQGQPGQKYRETSPPPSQPIAGCDVVHLSPQLCGEDPVQKLPVG